MLLRRLSLALLLGVTLTGAEPTVRVQTELGTFDIELAAAQAPKSVANFLHYVSAGHYTGGIFHRTVRLQPDNQPDNDVKIEVIQASVSRNKAAADLAPIALERTRETGLLHRDGTISMARDGPDTATSDFFICIGDQPELDYGGRRNPDGQGFAAFGRVVRGMDIVRAIHQSPAREQTLEPPVRILSIKLLP